MRFSTRPDRFAATCLLAACLALVLSFALPASRAQDAPAEKSSDAAAGAEAPATFDIPEGDADSLQKFLHQLAEREPEGETEEEQKAFSIKLLNTLVVAGDKLIGAKPSDRQAAEGHNFKILALGILDQLQQQGAGEKLVKAIDAARNDKREDVAVVGWQSFIQSTFSTWETADADAKQKFLDEILARVKTDDVQPLDVSIVGVVATNLDGTDDEFVARLLAAANPLIEKSDDETVKQAFGEANLQGIVRRLNLLGRPIEISGKLLDGKEVDWESYRGKVVLVDFWASWCGPCRREIPNILKLYEAYHDKGFDVLGVSLDLTKQDAERAMREDGIPWPSIFQEPDKNAVDPRFSKPLVRHYGIGGIPKAILVDQEGKVVHMEARGENLAKELQRLLGDPRAPLDKGAKGEKSELKTALEK